MNGGHELLRRYLQQRAELGEVELVLATPPGAVLGALAAHDALAESTDRREIQERDPSGPAPAEGAQRISRAPAVVAPVPPAAARAATPRGEIGSPTLAELQTLASACTACRLAATRRTVVFGEGNPAPDVVVVGEAPGAEEDRTGRPFVGKAGRLLDTLLESVGMARESVYICNVLKCRPPENRNPQEDEIEACGGFLRRQIEILGPRAILAVGAFPAQTLLRTTRSIARLRGATHRYGEIPVVPTYHPAALLRNPVLIRPVWEDLQRLRSVLELDDAFAPDAVPMTTGRS